MPVRATQAMIVALRDGDLSVVTKAAYALGELKNEAAIPALVALIGREERELEATLVLAIEKFGCAAMQPLIEALADTSWRVREQSASILGVLGESDALPALLHALRDREWQVRFAAAHSAGTLGGDAVGPALAVMLQDPDPRVRAMAARMMAGAQLSAH